METRSTAVRRAEVALPVRLVASWLGCGYARWAPGTVGSLAACFVALALAHYAGWRPWRLALLSALLLAPAVWAAGRVVQAGESRDPRWVVVDEVLGQWLALAALPVLDWRGAAAAFLLFRLFDIVKPPPVRQMEALPGGWGIVADDLAAGGYAALVLWLAGCFNLY